jgi:UDP-N-acetylglucosamine acyltransferase
MSLIHPTAIVATGAKIGEGTRVGPYSIIDGEVSLGSGCDIQSHVVIRGRTTIGNGVTVFPFAVLGAEPQDLKYRGEPTRTEIGDGVTIRESVTVHRGTQSGGGLTVVGANSLIMAYTHVAHDCVVGKNVIIANGTQLAGHASIGDFAIVGGMVAIIQYTRIGSYAYIGGASAIRKDVTPYMVGKGADFKVQGVNVVGLSRRGFSSEALDQLKLVYKIFFLQNLTTSRAIEKIQMEVGDSEHVREFINFVKSSKVGFER